MKGYMSLPSDTPPAARPKHPSGRPRQTKAKALLALETLSALESALLASSSKTFPDYLHEQLHEVMEDLRVIILEN